MATNTTDYEIIEIDAISGEVVYRNFNDAERTQRQNDIETFANQKLEAETQLQAKANLLDRLGITADEAALLLS
jgi:hypothetical protein